MYVKTKGKLSDVYHNLSLQIVDPVKAQLFYILTI